MLICALLYVRKLRSYRSCMYVSWRAYLKSIPKSISASHMKSLPVRECECWCVLKENSKAFRKARNALTFVERLGGHRSSVPGGRTFASASFKGQLSCASPSLARRQPLFRMHRWGAGSFRRLKSNIFQASVNLSWKTTNRSKRSVPAVAGVFCRIDPKLSCVDGHGYDFI